MPVISVAHSQPQVTKTLHKESPTQAPDYSNIDFVKKTG